MPILYKMFEISPAPQFLVDSGKIGYGKQIVDGKFPELSLKDFL